MAGTTRSSSPASIRSHDRITFEGDRTLTDKKMGFTDPWVTLTVTLQSGEKKSVIIGNEKVAMRWVRNPDNKKVVFTLYGYGFDGLNPELAVLKEVTPASGMDSAGVPAGRTSQKPVK